MNLWIRSQNEEVLIPNPKLSLEKIENEYWIIDLCDDTVLGTYKSKERALEVLNEIQSCMQTNCLFDLYSKMGNFPDDFNKKWNCVPVYVMPKE